MTAIRTVVFARICASIIAGTALLFVPSLANAQSSSTTLDVSATVSNNCSISTAALAFGSYDPVVANSTSPLDATGTVTIACTKNAVTTIGLDLGLNASGTTRQLSDGSNLLAYEIYQDAALSVVWGNSGSDLFDSGTAPDLNPRSFTVYGRIGAGQDVPAGAFTDTVTATVNF